MLHDLTRWLLYSPARLVSVTLVVLAVTAVAWTGLAPEKDHLEASPPKTTQPGVALSTTDQSASALAQERTGSSRAVLRTAQQFLSQYVVSPSARTPGATPLGLQGVTTPALWEGLRLTDPNTLPRGAVQSIELEAAGPYSGAVLAELDNGAGLALSVVAWQRGWRISDVRPAEDS
jgi:hypothetical protein